MKHLFSETMATQIPSISAQLKKWKKIEILLYTSDTIPMKKMLRETLPSTTMQKNSRNEPWGDCAESADGRKWSNSISHTKWSREFHEPTLAFEDSSSSTADS